MTTFLMAEIIDIFYQFLFPFSRLSAFLLASPFYSIESINVRFRIAISAVFTFLYLSYLEGVSIDPLTSVGFLYILQEIAIGVILGFSLQLVSAAITVGGQAISNAMGLGMANMFDPNLGNVPVISQFLIILSTLIFLLIDGHLVIIDLTTRINATGFLRWAFTRVAYDDLSFTCQYWTRDYHQIGAIFKYYCSWISSYTPNWKHSSYSRTSGSPKTNTRFLDRVI